MVPPAPIVYVETSVFSYLAARPSRDLVVAAHQRLTADWWHDAPARFALVVSTVVLREVAAGDPAAAASRAELLDGLPLLEFTPDAVALAAELLRAGLLPPRATADAAHVAIAALGGADYLVTWNMRHLAGAVARRRIEGALRARGYEPPTICTPEEISPRTLPPGAPDV
jgi:predicted nucleic acid-binding protein